MSSNGEKTLRVRYEWDATDEDADAVRRKLAEAASDYIQATGFDTSKWSAEQFDLFIQTMLLTVLLHVSAWGMMRHEQQLEGCSDGAEPPYEVVR